MEAGDLLSAEDFTTITADDLNSLVTEADKGKSLDDWMAELNALTGLASVKEQVQRKVNTVLAQQKMKEAGIGKSFDPGTLHMVFRGNAGTGKTTVARILAGIYNTLGLLPDGDTFIECGRSDLVGEYQGHTAKKVKDVINRSLGGVLFIDEAYALCRDANDTFGREAVDALIADMENHRKELMVILAGYSSDMDAFFEHNQGMASRVPTSLTFEDYTLDELFQIFQNIIKGKGFVLSEEAAPMARDLIARESMKHNFGNARGVRNIAERITESHTAAIGERIARGEELQESDYLTILPADIAQSVQGGEI
jgi:SpoVK/Ycf46/Vps4 family AAA+-type ATPase